MRPARLSTLSVEQLVQLFAGLAAQQGMAMLAGPQARVNKLYWHIEAIKNELKERPGDQRAALLSLYNHSDRQVRLKAAKATLAVSPVAARRLLEEIANSGWHAQAGDAGMTLLALDEGTFKPS